MKDVVIFAGSSIGSVLALAEEIKLSYDVKVIVLCLKSNETVESIFNKSKFIDKVEVFNYSSTVDFFKQIEVWTMRQAFTEKPIMYFTTDSSCYLVNLYRDWFEENYTLILPSSEIINIYTHKGIAEVEASNNGLTCTKRIVIKTEKEVFLVDKEFEFPVIIKPTTSYDSNRVPFKTKKLDKDEFIGCQLDLLKKGYQVICQEFIPGDDHKVFFFLFHRDGNGNLDYVLGKKILQNPPSAGLMAKGIVEENEELSKICAEFLEKINYVGIGGMEFKQYKDKFYFIEMNTRVEAILKISGLAGVPLGRIAYETSCGNQKNKLYTAKIGVEYNDLLYLFSAYRSEKKYCLFFKELFNL